ncbi:hypothetical protein OSB04_010198 [Centaurea solstitialis]|uniref:Post-GPI attachment to proteins factor 3 n=1 Tax=Centaurea solstitialis TaxID=347529 RepID=A0AA38T735_9ASTR|nr:hypothetical protein OSB04_010198 [Centaurea solstitialis]
MRVRSIDLAMRPLLELSTDPDDHLYGIDPSMPWNSSSSTNAYSQCYQACQVNHGFVDAMPDQLQNINNMPLNSYIFIIFVTSGPSQGNILYLNNYKLDYGKSNSLNSARGTFVGRSPVDYYQAIQDTHKNPTVYDFPPYEGFVDAHAVWHATTVPLTYLWWSSIKYDVELRTSILLKKVAVQKKNKSLQLYLPAR